MAVPRPPALDAHRDEVEQSLVDPRGGRVDLTEDARDVDAAMGRGVRPEAPRGLRELPRCAVPVSPRGVVPGDRDVDEALEEVPLRRGRVAPLVLELLVRLEVRALADQGDPLLEPHRAKYPESESDSGLAEC